MVAPWLRVVTWCLKKILQIPWFDSSCCCSMRHWNLTIFYVDKTRVLNLGQSFLVNVPINAWRLEKTTLCFSNFFILWRKTKRQDSSLNAFAWLFVAKQWEVWIARVWSKIDWCQPKNMTIQWKKLHLSQSPHFSSKKEGTLWETSPLVWESPSWCDALFTIALALFFFMNDVQEKQNVAFTTKTFSPQARKRKGELRIWSLHQFLAGFAAQAKKRLADNETEKLSRGKSIQRNN